MLHKIKIKKEYLVGASACFLCFLSAALNVHFVRLFAFAVGYLAGDIIRLFIDVSQEKYGQQDSIILLLIILSFIGGAIAAGIVIHHPRFDVERPYGRSLIAIGALFLVAGLLERSLISLALPIAAFASGLQNALATNYRGVILRTTHITGIVTDFGQALGMRLAGNVIQPWKIWLHLFLFLSYLLGIAAGICIDFVSGDRATLVLAPVYIFFGTSLYLFQQRLRSFF